MFVDTHAHLSDSKYVGEVESVIQRAADMGVTTIICPASNLQDARKIVQLTNQCPRVYGCAGLYPGEWHKARDWQSDLREIEEIIKSNKKIVGVGEIGLDRYWNERGEEQELEVLRAQLEIAVRLDLPVVIHNRGSHKLIRQVLNGLRKVPRGQFHCFSGEREFLGWVLDMGFFVGFDGNITYPANQELRELVKLVPSDRLLLETDAPYLPPQGKRGERNEPGNVTILAQLQAELRGVTIAELGRQTTENAVRLFDL